MVLYRSSVYVIVVNLVSFVGFLVVGTDVSLTLLPPLGLFSSNLVSLAILDMRAFALS